MIIVGRRLDNFTMSIERDKNRFAIERRGSIAGGLNRIGATDFTIVAIEIRLKNG